VSPHKDTTEADAADFHRMGVYDPVRPGAAERLSLLRHARALGASLEELASRSNLGDLIVDLKLRPRLDLTLGQAVRETALAWGDAERLLAAMGLPTDPDARVTADELGAIRLLAVAVTQLLGFDASIQLARAVGGAMARVAEAAVTAVRLRVEQPRRDTGTADEDIVRGFSEITETMLPDFVRTLNAGLRYQLVCVAPTWSTDTERSAVVLPRTVGFADLVGYTTTAAEMSVRELTAVLMEFDEATSTAVRAEGGRIVKMIGDEAMFVTEDPAPSCRIALRLTSTFGHGTLPPVRVGLAAGQVVSVFGDIYGPVVNLAHRLVGAAEPSTVLVSESIIQACEPDLRFERPNLLEVKGIAEPVPVARIQVKEPNTTAAKDLARAERQFSAADRDGGPDAPALRDD
jgi:adenylate cyclase